MQKSNCRHTALHCHLSIVPAKSWMAVNGQNNGNSCHLWNLGTSGGMCIATNYSPGPCVWRQRVRTSLLAPEGRMPCVWRWGSWSSEEFAWTGLPSCYASPSEVVMIWVKTWKEIFSRHNSMSAGERCGCGSVTLMASCCRLSCVMAAFRGHSPTSTLLLTFPPKVFIPKRCDCALF